MAEYQLFDWRRSFDETYRSSALAVTMRGLTLREITTRHWFHVMFKEAGAGLINGLAIALTCSLGVYLWSPNFGLSLFIALAMVMSMTIAGLGGALVPICLQKLGQDPAQSSSIILTTVTNLTPSASISDAGEFRDLKEHTLLERFVQILNMLRANL